MASGKQYVNSEIDHSFPAILETIWCPVITNLEYLNFVNIPVCMNP